MGTGPGPLTLFGGGRNVILVWPFKLSLSSAGFGTVCAGSRHPFVGAESRLQLNMSNMLGGPSCAGIQQQDGSDENWPSSVICRRMSVISGRAQLATLY